MNVVSAWEEVQTEAKVLPFSSIHVYLACSLMEKVTKIQNNTADDVPMQNLPGHFNN